MPRYEIHSCEQMMELIQQLGFLPLLVSGIPGYSAEEMADEECRYIVYPDGGWDWPLWKWKGIIINESDCVYGKFFNGKAGFISRAWWPDFYNYRRSIYPQPEIGSVGEAILTALREQGSAIARDLRAACGMTGPKIRSRFDAYVNKLQMGCYIVTEDFVYPRDKHGKEYGFGWQLLNTPENLLGRDACLSYTDETHTILRSPQESYERILVHLQTILPDAAIKQLNKLIK